MNRRPNKLHWYDQLALILATTHEPKTALTCWQAMRSMVPAKMELFALKPKFTFSGERALLYDQICRMTDKGASYSAIAQQLRIDWRTAKRIRLWWVSLSDEEREQHRERLARQEERNSTAVQHARSYVSKRKLAELADGGDA